MKRNWRKLGGHQPKYYRKLSPISASLVPSPTRRLVFSSTDTKNLKESSTYHHRNCSRKYCIHHCRSRAFLGCNLHRAACPHEMLSIGFCRGILTPEYFSNRLLHECWGRSGGSRSLAEYIFARRGAPKSAPRFIGLRREFDWV